MTELTDKRYYSTPDVAHMFGVKTATVRDWIREGQIKAIKLPGGSRWRIELAELQRFAKKREEG